MKKLVTLDFKKGSFENGFTVSVDIRDQDTERLLAGIDNSELPSESEIPKLYSEWQSAYRGLNLRNRLEAFANQVTNVALLEDAENCEQCEQCAKTLSNLLNRWFWSPSFREARDMLIRQTSKEDDVRILLKSNDPILHRLPWHLWDLFDNSKAEFAWSIGSYILNKNAKISEKNRVLAILGSSKDINIDADRKMLESLPNAEIKFLVQPSKDDLSDELWKDKWDILFFAGHSFSQSGAGRIYINENESLAINELTSALQNAIKSGLKLAIFNSCDGLGLAGSLSQLHIPQVIVMREPIPDAVAQRFLKYFLEYFSNGNSLYTSVSYARGRLEAIEDYFPCASWLPIICQNPAEDSLIWKKTSISIWAKFLATFKKILATFKKILAKFLPMFILGVILAVLAAILIHLRFTPIDVPQQTSIDVSQRISYGEKFLIDNKFVTDDKKVPLRNSLSRDAFNPKAWDGTISRFENYLYGTNPNITSDTPLQKNDPESLIYLNNAIAEKNGNYVTIAVSVPIVEDPEYLIGISQEILRGVAMVQNEVNRGNENERINKKFLKVLIAKDDNAADDKRDVVQAIANNFVANGKILAVVGHNSTSASLAAADIYKDKLLAISPTSNGGVLDNKNNYYRTVPFVGRDAEVLKNHAKEKGWKKIGICFQKNDPSSESLKEAFAKKLNDSQIEAIDKFCDSLEGKNEKDAREIIRKFNIEEGVNALFLIPSIKTIPEALMIAKANYDSPKLPLIANATMYTSETINQDNKDSVIGMVLVTVWHPEFDSTKSFADTSKNFWSGSTINWRTATSYDATKVIVEGLNKTNLSRESLIKFVADKPKVQTKTGIETKNTINFQNTGARDALIRRIQIIKKGDGKLQFTPFIEPASSNNKN
ncbi:MAG: ABC transporter substrate-binding protein [Pseudanabaena sp.]|jgi:branched-chain amino acid transport system substrate-binding protein